MKQRKRYWAIGFAAAFIATCLLLPSLVESRRDLYMRHLNGRLHDRGRIADLPSDEGRVREACRQMSSLLNLSPETQGGGFDLLVALDHSVKDQITKQTYGDLGVFGKLRALWAGPNEADLARARRYATELVGHTRDARKVADWAGYCATLRFNGPDS